MHPALRPSGTAAQKKGIETMEIIYQERKSAVLTPSRLRCLQDIPTINLTCGCALGCTYCYIQGYSNYPGPDRIILYSNLADKLRQELAGRRQKPRWVYFSPSSDPFQYSRAVRDLAFEVMQTLLESGIGIAFLTKGFVDRPFLDLFAAQPAKIHAQVGLITVDRGLSRALEPHAAPAPARIRLLERFATIGVQAEARLDPMIPGLTDTPPALHRLFDALRTAGVRTAAVGYLLLRSKISEAIARQTSDPQIVSHIRQIGSSFETVELAGAETHGRIPPPQLRSASLKRVFEIARQYGVEILICGCKIPDFASCRCNISGRAGIADKPRGSSCKSLFPTV